MKKTKKIIALLLSAVMAVSAAPAGTVTASAASSVKVWNGKADTSWYSSKKTTFKLSTAEQLAGLAKIVDSGKDTFEGKTIKLTKNIKLNDTSDFKNWAKKAPKNVWEPIGGAYNWIKEQHFNGIFDGQGHTISGMYVNSTSQPDGLFATTVNAALMNVKMEKCAIVCSPSDILGHPCGSLVGFCDNSYIESCEAKDIYITGTMGAFSDNKAFGGLVGKAEHIESNVTIWTLLTLGGLIFNPILLSDLEDGKKIDGSVISNCKVSDIVMDCYTSWGAPCVGGVIGFMSRGTIYNCLSLNCTLSSKAAPYTTAGNNKKTGEYCGAIAGNLTYDENTNDHKAYGKIKNCYYYNFKRSDGDTRQHDKDMAAKVSKSKLSSEKLLKKLGDRFTKGKDGLPKVKSIIAG